MAIDTLKTLNYDVVVCGGGFAGVSAAVSSAREGSRVLLVESGGEPQASNFPQQSHCRAIIRSGQVWRMEPDAAVKE